MKSNPSTVADVRISAVEGTANATVTTCEVGSGVVLPSRYIRYPANPEPPVSVDAPQPSVMLVVVVPVTARPLGTLGGVVSAAG